MKMKTEIPFATAVNPVRHVLHLGPRGSIAV
jgi:hypothetical protein